MKPKAPTQSPEQLLREAERAYHAYQFGPASTALSKYISSLQRRRQAVPDSITMLQGADSTCRAYVWRSR